MTPSSYLCFPSLIVSALWPLVLLLTLPSCAFMSYTEPIHDAAAKGDITELETILARGASINKRDARGRTPLYWAALNGHEDVIEYLLVNGADPVQGASWKGEDTPMHAAAKQGHDRVIRALADYGVNPNIQNSSGQTPLHLAAWARHYEAVTVLIEIGSTVTARDSRGYTPLHVERIFEGLPDTDNYERIVRALLLAGADVNALATKGRKGYTPLMGACRVGATEAVGLLIAAGADISARTYDGATPSYFAEVSGHDHIVKILHGATQRHR